MQWRCSILPSNYWLLSNSDGISPILSLPVLLVVSYFLMVNTQDRWSHGRKKERLMHYFRHHLDHQLTFVAKGEKCQNKVFIKDKRKKVYKKILTDISDRCINVSEMKQTRNHIQIYRHYYRGLHPETYCVQLPSLPGVQLSTSDSIVVGHLVLY